MHPADAARPGTSMPTPRRPACSLSLQAQGDRVFSLLGRGPDRQAAQARPALGELSLPKLGRVRFRWTRPVKGIIRNATVLKEAEDWFISLCIDDGRAEVQPNGKPAVGADRGVALALATSDGLRVTFTGAHIGERRRMRRLQQRIARQRSFSKRKDSTVRVARRLWQRVRSRRADFAHQIAHKLTTTRGMVVLESLHVQAMTRSARGTPQDPGRDVRQKAGLNRAMLDKAWGRLDAALQWHGKKNGCEIVHVPAAYTSITCSACGSRCRESRESQADFGCITCGCEDNADVNAAKNLLAAGLAVTGRGDLGGTQSAK